MKKMLVFLFAVILTVSALTIASFAANIEATVPKAEKAPVKDGVKDAVYDDGLVINIDKPNPAWTGTPQEGFYATATLVHDGTNLYIFAEAIGDETPAMGHAQPYSNDAFSPYFYNYAGIMQTTQWYYNRNFADDTFESMLLNGNGTPVSLLSSVGELDNGWCVEIVVAIIDIQQDLTDTALFDICYLDLNEDNSRNITVGAGSIGWGPKAEEAYKLSFAGGLTEETDPPVETKAPETKPADPPVETKPADKPEDTKPAETKPAETKPADTKAADTKAADTKAADSKAADSKAADTKAPAETKAAEKKKGCGSAVATLAVVPMLLAAAFVCGKKH